ncbi:uncharacterized protein B0I36DRAFT_436155 [Microdochium trichocladiopsis]|uniref:Uncharacterized protein n=1 Tax=Microdochium trichocladiopsis TaxID=1682393 RepID=A0A9P8XWN8_9PEZI|nr:uncharacterized protein B0I36DRAFT_436155 [Microdochium trichocladiopsis]KAH7016505.1 hypothetical protein B0I36DRAFT_436155 [Microdochium trichocladiopsis]
MVCDVADVSDGWGFDGLLVDVDSLDEPDAVAGLGCGPVTTEAFVECATRDSVMTTSTVASVFDHGFEQEFACCLKPAVFGVAHEVSPVASTSAAEQGERRADSRCAVGRKSRSVRCDERSDADPFRVRNCASRSATSYRCSVASVNANGSSSSMSASVVAEACLLQSADRWDSCADVSTFTSHGLSGRHDPSHSAQARERGGHLRNEIQKFISNPVTYEACRLENLVLALEIIALHGGHAWGTVPARPVKAISEIESGSLQSHGTPTWGAGPKVETLPD